jgi:hypothetical protein
MLVDTRTTGLEIRGATRADYQTLLRELKIPAESLATLTRKMEIYRLTAEERAVVVRMILGEGPKELRHNQGVSRDRYYNILESIGKKMSGGTSCSYGDRTLMVLTLLGIERRSNGSVE